MTVDIYKPREGSLPQLVTSFFARNPEEVLTLDDITNKFECGRGNIHTQLSSAVDHSLLERTRDADGEYVYKIGHRTTPVGTAPASKPVKVRQVTVPDRRWTLPDLTTLPLETGVPLIPPGRKSTDWTLLLDRMAPGSSAALPRPAKGSLKKAVTDRHKATGQRFTVGDVDAHTIRIWRTA